VGNKYIEDVVLNRSLLPQFIRSSSALTQCTSHKYSKLVTCDLLHTGSLLDLVSDPEDGGDIFLLRPTTGRYVPEDKSVLVFLSWPKFFSLGPGVAVP
jgi:hypothetical protein